MENDKFDLLTKEARIIELEKKAAGLHKDLERAAKEHSVAYQAFCTAQDRLGIAASEKMRISDSLGYTESAIGALRYELEEKAEELGLQRRAKKALDGMRRGKINVFRGTSGDIAIDLARDQFVAESEDETARTAAQSFAKLEAEEASRAAAGEGAA